MIRGEPVEFLGERGGPLRAGNIVAKGLLDPEFVPEEEPPHTRLNATPALASFTKDATYNNNTNISQFTHNSYLQNHRLSNKNRNIYQAMGFRKSKPLIKELLDEILIRFHRHW